jgi:hypothetical protein
VQLVTAGSGEGLVSCCGPYGGPARYALYTPDGETLRQSQAVVASDDPFLKRLSFVDMSLFRDGSRMLFLIPADRFDRSMSRATPLILDLTILPCPADMRRGNSIGGSSAVGGPPSWGRCYPTP